MNHIDCNKKGCATRRTIDYAQVGREKEREREKGRVGLETSLFAFWWFRTLIGWSGYLTGYGVVFDSFVFLRDIMIS